MRNLISKYDVIQTFKKAKKEGRQLAMYLSEDNKNLIETDTDKVVCSLDTYLDFLRKKLHCNFECIYHEHVSLVTIYRCKDCGTVIFGGDDEFTYDPNLKCPTCGNYKTHLEYWTKEEIDKDEKKQKTITLYEDMTREEIEMEKRRQARGGKYDWQIWNKQIYGKKRYWRFELQDFGRQLGVSKLNPNYKRPWYKCNLEFTIDTGKKDGISYSVTKHYRIPLAPYSFYLQFIFPYSKKCTPDLRKYYPWQKKPEKKETIC